jgi:hypothetical protein
MTQITQITQITVCKLAAISNRSKDPTCLKEIIEKIIRRKEE